MPEAAIFADTQAEPRAVHDWLAWLETQLPFPVYRVTEGSLTKKIGAKRVRGKYRSVPIPAFVKVNGEMAGLINRSCTQDFKIRPIRRQLRKLLGLTRRRSPSTVAVIQWMGISVDEAHRMNTSREPWIHLRYPLIESMKRRSDCLEWMRDHDFPTPPKSSCVYCPYHSAVQWRALTSDEMAEAIRVDESLRSAPSGEYRSKGTLFLHRSGKPLADLDFNAPSSNEPDLFGNECAGVCSV